MTDNLLTILADEIAKLFEPIRAVVNNPNLLDGLLGAIGASGEMAGSDKLASALSTIVDLGRQFDQLASAPAPSFEGIANCLEASKKAFQAVQALSDTGCPAEALGTFGRDLIDLLLVAYLERWHQLAREVAILLTLLEPAKTQDMQPGIADGDNIVR